MALDTGTFFEPKEYIDLGRWEEAILGQITSSAVQVIMPKLPLSGVVVESDASGNTETDELAKRVTESALALLGLVFLFPLFAIVALAIKLESRGPVFFRQLRTGKDGKTFKIFKFRTMQDQHSEKVVQATKNDSRITRIGRILRKTSIDELPQLFNVLVGDMALVGPRPHAIEHDRYYGALLPSYKQRFAVRPGLTGLAQVKGLRGETKTIEKMEQRVKCDIEYICRRSYWLDLAIIFTTPFVIFFQKNAC